MSNPRAASLTGSLLARKGAADAGFTDAPEAGAETGAEAPTQPKILIVEDNFLNMKLMLDLFDGHGYRTVRAVNGREAILMARAERPDLIVMDIKLPGLSGLEVIRRLKGDVDLRDIPVIAVTALARLEDEQMIRDAGFDEFLSKPFSVQSVLVTVARLLG